MRVLHVTSSFPRDGEDPTGIFVADLARAERDAGLDVAVIAPHDAGLASAGEVSDLLVWRFHYGPDTWEQLAYRGGLLAAARHPKAAVMVPAYVVAMTGAVRSAVRAWDPDIVHAHWWFPAGFAASVALARRPLVVTRRRPLVVTRRRPLVVTRRRPLVVTLHGSDVGLARAPGLRAIGRAVTRRAAIVTAVSAQLAAEAERLLGARVEVAPMPLPLLAETARAEPPERPPELPPPLRIVAAGRLSREKGFDVLIEACLALHTGGTDLRLELFGEGPEATGLRREGTVLGERLRMRGSRPRAEVHAAMTAAHVVAVPSRREGFGLVAAEALILGRPVVATDVGGLAGLVRDGINGLLVPPGDPSALARALERASGLVPPGVPAGLEGHQPRAVAEQHRMLYEQVLAPG